MVVAGAEIEVVIEEVHMTVSVAGKELARAVVVLWDRWGCLHSPGGCIQPAADHAEERVGPEDSHRQKCVAPEAGNRTAYGHKLVQSSCSLQLLLRQQALLVETEFGGLVEGVRRLATWELV